MPGEIMMHENDMPRELSFITRGVLEIRRGSTLIRLVRADSELSNVVSEVSFLMGIAEPYTG